MAIIHYLNVNKGDCSIIQHNTGHTTVIDVCNASQPTLATILAENRHKVLAATQKGINGNFNQKDYPVNPISYMQDHKIADVFRFILTHPDMDHMDGIKAFFKAYPPTNFWDTDNNCVKDWNSDNGQYNEEDWDFYTALRDHKPESDPKRLTLFAGAIGKYWNQNDEGKSGDGIQILAPTYQLLKNANECGDHNDSSYVILYRTGNYKILFGGDSHDKTWEHILQNHKDDVSNVDLLIAPHHGRDSDRCYEFLDVVNPALTLFGNANSSHLAYPAWNRRNLKKITNNQGGCVLIETTESAMSAYVTCAAFAKACNPFSFASNSHAGYHYYGTVNRSKGVTA